MTITISNDDLHTANARLALRVADLEHERDVLAGECRDAQATAQQFKDERDRYRADARVSAEMAAAMSRDRARALTAAQEAVQALTNTVRDNSRLERDLDAAQADNEQLRAEVAGLEQLRQAVAEARGRRRLRRRTR